MSAHPSDRASGGGAFSGDELARWNVRRASSPALRARRVALRGAWTLDELAGRFVELSGEGAASWMTLAFALVVDVQRREEPVAWITNRQSTFFPPDAALNGVDLERLPVIFAPDAPGAARAAERLARSGGFGLLVLDLISAVPVRGARRQPTPSSLAPTPLPPALQSRLAALAQKHELAIVCMTEKPSAQASLGPMVSLRCEAVRSEAVRSEAVRSEAGSGDVARFPSASSASSSASEPPDSTVTTMPAPLVLDAPTYTCRVDVVRDKRPGGTAGGPPGAEGRRRADAEVCRGPAGLR